MTLTETEKRFYEAFDIEPMYIDVYIKEAYPPITDHVLLELIKLLLCRCEITLYHDSFTNEKFKEDLLQVVMHWCSGLYHYEDDVRKIMGWSR